MSCSKKLCQTKFGPEVFNKASPFDKSKVYLTGSIHHTYEIKNPQYHSILYNIKHLLQYCCELYYMVWYTCIITCYAVISFVTTPGNTSSRGAKLYVIIFVLTL